MSSMVANRPVGRHETLFERATRGVGRVDAENGILFRVKLVGPRGNRDYPPAVLRAAVGLYRDRPVYIEHADQRGYGDRLGFVRNPRFEGDSIFGDVHLNVGHPLAKAVLHDAVHNPGSLGMSHTASGVTRYVDGRQVCERLDSIESVDLCLSPASVAGLFEGKSKPGVRRPKTWHYPRSADEAKQRLLGEGTASAVDPGDDLGEPVDDADDAVDTVAVLSAVQAIVSGAGSDGDKLASIRAALGMERAPVATTTEPATTATAEESIADWSRRVCGRPSIAEVKAAAKRLIR